MKMQLLIQEGSGSLLNKVANVQGVHPQTWQNWELRFMLQRSRVLN